MFGLFFNDLIFFRAQKKVVVRARNIGLLHKFLVGLIFLYLFGVQVLYKGKHMASTSPTGTVRVSAQRPVVDRCNVNDPTCQPDFTAREDLPYCMQSRRSDSPDDSDVKYPCEYWDEMEMDRSSGQQGRVVIPTRVTLQTQFRTGDCDLGAKPHACKNVYTSHSHGNTTYIADIERFTILIDHAFTIPVADTEVLEQLNRGSTIDFPGYWRSCKHGEAEADCELVRVPCVPGTVCDGAEADEEHIPEQKDETAERFGIYGTSSGDVVPVSTLLLLAGVDLDKDYNSDGELLRHTGIVIQIDIRYLNREPFRWKFWEPGPLRYVYHVTRLPVETYKAIQTLNLDDNRRLVSDIHGILIYASLGGEIAHMDVMHPLVLLASAATLLSVVDLALHLYCSMVWKHRAAYQESKEDWSLHFDHMSSLESAESDELLMREEICKSLLGEGHKDAYISFVRKFIALDGEALRLAAHVTCQNAQKLTAEEKETVREQFAKYASYSQVTPSV